MTTREEYERNMARMATEAFQGHQIARRSEGRWFLARPAASGWDDPNKRWDWCMATEVIADLWGGGMFVGGDIDHVIFRHYNGPPEARVRWMGSSRKGATDCYLVEKAIIGTGRELVEVYQGDIAHSDLVQLQKEIGEDEEGRGKKKGPVLEAIESIKRCCYDMGRDEVIRDLLATDYFEGEEIYDTGMVVAPRVFHAHAALRKLCDLLDQEKEKQP
jgi:hypothetical protein